jgi:hypothetical protein
LSGKGQLQQGRWTVGLDGHRKVVRTRETADATGTETGYYLLSAALAPQRFYRAVRQQWDVESASEPHDP